MGFLVHGFDCTLVCLAEYLTRSSGVEFIHALLLSNNFPEENKRCDVFTFLTVWPHLNMMVSSFLMLKGLVPFVLMQVADESFIEHFRCLMYFLRIAFRCTDTFIRLFVNLKAALICFESSSSPPVALQILFPY